MQSMFWHCLTVVSSDCQNNLSSASCFICILWATYITGSYSQTFGWVGPDVLKKHIRKTGILNYITLQTSKLASLFLVCSSQHTNNMLTFLHVVNGWDSVTTASLLNSVHCLMFHNHKHPVLEVGTGQKIL
jgi:hypothetical protein